MKKKQDYLEGAVINDYSEYSPKGLKLRAQPFLDTKLPSKPNRLLVTGVALGGSEEIAALNKFFPEYEIFGIDVARSALNQKVGAKLVYSDIADLQFKDDYFSGIMCSAVMHEVFSYSDNGKDKVKKSISEISRTLSKGGVCAIREFFVPENKQCKLICKTKEAKEFMKIFICKFRNNFNKDLQKGFVLKNGELHGGRRLLTELMLHFRVASVHFKTTSDFLNSKEIEEEYLPMSSLDYSKLIEESGMKILGIKYIDFPKYYSVIDKHFELTDLNNKNINNKFGFVDITFMKE